MNCVGKMLGNLNEGNTSLLGFNSWHLSFCCSLQVNIHQLYVRECSDYVKYWCQTEKATSMLELFGLSKLLKKNPTKPKKPTKQKQPINLMCILVLVKQKTALTIDFPLPPWFLVITVMNLIFLTTKNPLPSVGYVIFWT